MSDFLTELGDYVVIQGVTTSDKVKIGYFPDDPDTCVAFIGRVGTNLTSSRDVPELQFPRFQVVTRSVDYEEASTLLNGVREALHGKIGMFLPHYRILRLHAEQDGGPIGQDAKGRFEFSINFIAEHHITDSLED